MPKGRPNPPALYGIYARPWGFEVSLMRGGVRYSRLFGKASYGGEAQALLQAQDWRDMIVRTVPPVARRTRAEKLRANNSSGVPGVSSRVAPDGHVQAWVAKTYLGPDALLQASFLVAEEGHAARTLAVVERMQQLAQMTGLARLHPAEELIRNGAMLHAPAPRAPRRSKSEILRRNNSSGISGVQFKAPRATHPGYWLAITYAAGQGTVSKAFSVKEHGHAQARQLAIEERRRQLAQKALNRPESASGRTAPSASP